jgi:single-strand DNA-binding protein
MFDTNLVVVGNVLTAPEWRRLSNSGSLVANFRIASTARRFDRERSQWVDGNSFRVRVTAWRRLAEGVASSIAVGDPVMVYGRLYCRDWQDDNGNNRIAYEMEAFSIGHDLARGRARFFRTRLMPVTSELESADAESHARGEASVPLTADEAPVTYGDGLPDQLSEDEPTFTEVIPEPVLTPGSISASAPASPSQSSDRASAGASASDPSAAPEPWSTPDSASGSAPGSALESAPGSTSAVASPPEDEPAPEDESPSGTDDLTLEVERLVADQQPAPSRRRTRKREPVAV